MGYIENPKTKGSGILCAIPQAGECPVRCPDCFFQSGRSYLEPLSENLPNMPPVEMTRGRVVRVNDGNDSNVQRDRVIEAAAQYEHAFFNTALLRRPGTHGSPTDGSDLAAFGRPVVLTVNPAGMTDIKARLIEICPANLMFVRVRVNAWNLELVDQVVAHYTPKGVPVVLTFLAYFAEQIPSQHENDYGFRKRTLNSYWCPRGHFWERVSARYERNSLVYTCGKDSTTYACNRCGHCLREYFATMERLRAAESQKESV